MYTHFFSWRETAWLVVAVKCTTRKANPLDAGWELIRKEWRLHLVSTLVLGVERARMETKDRRGSKGTPTNVFSFPTGVASQ